MGETVPRRRRRGSKTRGYVSRAIKKYALGVLFVMLGAFIIGVVGYLVGLVPETVITIGSLNLTNKLILEFVSWVAGIIFVLTGIKRFGIPI
jgi:hypothetical protein